MMSSVSTTRRIFVLTVLLQVLLLNSCSARTVTANGAFVDTRGFAGGYFECLCKTDTYNTQTTACNYTSYDTYMTYIGNDYKKTCDNIHEFPMSVDSIDKGENITFILRQKSSWPTNNKDPTSCLLFTAQKAVSTMCMQRVVSTQPTTVSIATTTTTTPTQYTSTITTKHTTSSTPTTTSAFESTNTETTMLLTTSTSAPSSTQTMTVIPSSPPPKTTTTGTETTTIATSVTSSIRHTSSSSSEPSTSSTQRASSRPPTSSTQRVSSSEPPTSSTQRASSVPPTSSSTRRASSSGPATTSATQRASSPPFYDDTTTPSQQENANTPMDSDTVILLGVGCTLGALLLAVVIIGVCGLYYASRRRRKHVDDMESTDGSWRDSVLSTGNVVIPRSDTNSVYKPSREIMNSAVNYSPTYNRY